MIETLPWLLCPDAKFPDNVCVCVHEELQHELRRLKEDLHEAKRFQVISGTSKLTLPPISK